MYCRSAEQLQISDTLQPSRLGASSTEYIGDGNDDDEMAMMVMMMVMMMMMVMVVFVMVMMAIRIL